METTTSPGLSGQYQKVSAFDRLKKKLEHKPRVYSPAGLSAYIGRKTLGKKEFQKRAEAGRRKHG